MTNSINADELKELISGESSVTLLDVRRKSDHEVNPKQIPGSIWHNPEHIGEWGDQLPLENRTVVYCVKGGSVSQSIADRLQQQGFDVAFLEGGLKSWLDQGNTTE